MPEAAARNRRADARRSRAAILEAAVRLLDTNPDAGVEAVATAAGVTRQTVYAHFPSREKLLAAVVDHVTAEAVAAMDAADLDTGPAADALLRLLEAGQRTAGRHPVLMRAVAALPVAPEADHDRHAPVAERLARVIRRGREAGEFDDGLPLDWQIAVTVKLGHAASEEVDAGRLSEGEAARTLRTTLLRVLRADR
ncbi:TetR/AcrR family transcriptional regulator [Saccharothrix luteola]|uniref:TetR/AcrR family transcriptional regulator n=1 Tax=Saccharothrix luteola TaxID=2893018 RepID=UPI001E62011E|nr:TetR/AcrR family transcriptional regulator [Saccharothrix luteola]MCC8247477.1 TetR/AcrR family transcriptional regulator; helix-turn-helix transcriptional regulator [Saccharothrix luteola]